MAVCEICKEKPQVVRLLKCAECFKPVCERCATRKYGNLFCCNNCAIAFFFGVEEEPHS